MPVLQVQDEFQSGDNVTATSLNNLVNEASFVSGAVDNSTLQVASAGHLKVKDNGILSNHLKSDASNDSVRAVTTNHIRNDAVTNAKIANLAVDTDQIAADAVEYSKMQNVAAFSVIGNNTNASANPTAIAIDDLKDNISNATPHDATPDSNGVNTTGGEDGLMSAEDKTKLNSVDHGAEQNVQSDWSQTTNTADDFIKNKPNIAYTSAISNATAHNATPDSNGVNTTGGADGLMSAEDKTKLDGVEAGAEVNPGNATTSADGLMSSTDKTKLNGIATGAEKNVQSDWDQTTTTADDFIKNKPNIAYTSAIPNATASDGGLMSSADKQKLNGLTTYSAGTGLSLSGTQFSVSEPMPVKAITLNPTTTDRIKSTYTNAERASLGIPTNGGCIIQARSSTGNDDGELVAISNRGDGNTSYGRVMVMNVSPNAKGAIFQAVAFRPTATALANSPSNSSDSTWYIAATIQCQTLHAGNFSGYAPRLAVTYQNFAETNADGNNNYGISNIYMNLGSVYGHSNASSSHSNRVTSNGEFELGRAAFKWKEVFAINGTINTSDQRLKQDIEDLSEAETRVAIAAKGLLKKYRWKEAVQQKGENARIHFGVIAQDLIAAFEAEGLDPFKYAVLCFNEWWRNPEDASDCRDEEVEGFQYESQYAVRYEELLAFIIAAL